MIKHIVSVSGGLSSAIVLDLVIKRYGVANTIAVFCDTKSEDVDLYRFNDDIKSRYPDLEWVTLCDGRTIWELFADRGYHSNNRIAHCSAYLKHRLFKRWFKGYSKMHKLNADDIIIYIGIGFEEMHRVIPITKNWEPYKVEFPLIDWVKLMPSDKMTYFAEIPPPRLYALGFSHNNCGGACIKAGQGQMRLLHEKLPEQYAFHEEQQERILRDNPDLKPAIRVQKNNVIGYYSMRQFREQFIEQSPELIDNLDIGGCGCFTEGYENESEI